MTPGRAEAALAGWPTSLPPPPDLGGGAAGLACDVVDASQLPLVRALLARAVSAADVDLDRLGAVLSDLVCLALAWVRGPVRACVLRAVGGWVVDVRGDAPGAPDDGVPSTAAAGPHGWYPSPAGSHVWAAVLT